MCQILVVTKKGKKIVGGVSSFFKPEGNIDEIKVTAGERALFQAQRSPKKPSANRKSRPAWANGLTASQARSIGLRL